MTDKTDLSLLRIKKADLPKIKIMLLKQQMGVCPLCQRDLRKLPSKDQVVDHDHKTGMIRGILCRACNGAEGKAKNAIERWGRATDIVAYLKNLVKYYESFETKYMYPSHKTDEEKRLLRNKRQRDARRKKKSELLKEMQESNSGTTSKD